MNKQTEKDVQRYIGLRAGVSDDRIFVSERCHRFNITALPVATHSRSWFAPWIIEPRVHVTTRTWSKPYVQHVCSHWFMYLTRSQSTISGHKTRDWNFARFRGTVGTLVDPLVDYSERSAFRNRRCNIDTRPRSIKLPRSLYFWRKILRDFPSQTQTRRASRAAIRSRSTRINKTWKR